MYDFYPDWGPARHRDESEPHPARRRERYWQARPDSQVPVMAGGPEARDAEGDRPDDN